MSFIHSVTIFWISTLSNAMFSTRKMKTEHRAYSQDMNRYGLKQWREQLLQVEAHYHHLLGV